MAISTENVLQFCKKSLQKQIINVLKLSSETEVNVLKRNKQLTKGDFMVVIPNWKSDSDSRQSHSQNVNGSDRSLSELNDGINCPSVPRDELKHASQIMVKLQDQVFTDLHPLQITVTDVTPSRDIYLRLDRTSAYNTVIPQVLQEGPHYGTSPSIHAACLNVTCLAGNADWTGFSTNHLRSLLLSEHITALLSHNGYEVNYVQYHIAEKWRQLNDLGILWDKYHEDCLSSRPEHHTSTHDILHRLEGCRYWETGDGTANQTAMINLRQYLADTGLSGHYTTNLTLADFSSESNRIVELTRLENHYRSMTQGCSWMIHLVPQERSFWMQTVDVGWKMINEKVEKSLNQVHIVHGPVTSRQGQPNLGDAQDHLRLRRKAVREAFIMKYGNEVQGSGLVDKVEELARAAVTFDLLSTSCTQPVKVDMCEGRSETAESHPGVFVMYNCARLATLFHRYQEAITAGTYPELPAVDTMDFSLLREEESWILLFNYVMLYPTMLRSCVSVATDGKRLNIHTHKICQFARDMCRDLSMFYSRIYVLAEPREHLLPLMFCRLYLLKTVQQILHNCLGLLNIAPVSQL